MQDAQEAAGTAVKPRSEMSPLVASIVINWRRPDETLDCVRYLLASDYPNHRVLVVDNSAGTSGVEKLLAGLPVEIVPSPGNIGAAGGGNIGLRRSLEIGADYAWLVNGDAIVQPDTLPRLVATAEADPLIGMVSPTFHDTEARDTPTLYLQVFQPHTQTAAETIDLEEAQHWYAERGVQVVFPSTALLVRRAAIDAIGMIDEQFFIYIEDTDYCLHCRDAGFRLVPCFDVVVYHRFKSPIGTPDATPLYAHYYMSRNYLLLWRKRSRRWFSKKATVWLLYERLGQIELTASLPAVQNAILTGVWDGLRGIGGPYDPARKPPAWFRAIVGRHPRLIMNLIDRKLF